MLSAVYYLLSGLESSFWNEDVLKKHRIFAFHYQTAETKDPQEIIIYPEISCWEKQSVGILVSARERTCFPRKDVTHLWSPYWRDWDSEKSDGSDHTLTGST